VLSIDFGVRLSPSKCPLPNLGDPHLVRQLHLLRLDRQQLSKLAAKYEQKLSPSLHYFLMFYGRAIIELPDKHETELLEFLEWYGSVLDLTHELIEDYESVQLSDPPTDVEIEALQLSFEIEEKESNDFYTQLFDGLTPESSITDDIKTIYNNARKIDEY
jgi:hypothetical protein